MTVWFAARIVKFLALALWAGAAGGALVSPDRGRKVRLTYLSLLGLATVWISGHLLAVQSDQAVTEPWILLSLGLSFASLHVLFLHAHAEKLRRPGLTAALVTGLGAAAFAPMVLRNAGLGLMLGVAAAAGLIGTLLGPQLARAPSATSDADRGEMRGGFTWLARAEGVTLLLLLVGIPLRKAAGIHLDGGTGTLGWAHGMLFFLYLQALASTARALGWSWFTTALGAAASVVPGGTFVFERWVARTAGPSPGS